MLHRHRHEQILKLIESEHRVRVTNLVESLGVSDETVRRDLKDLEAEGLLRRIHGGAVSLSPIHDKPIDERGYKNSKQKTTIAQLAVREISDETVIFLDTGTTTLSIARHLQGFNNLKLYTNSLKIATEASKNHGVKVHLTPGKLRSVEQDLIGYETISYLQKFYFDIAFMGAAAIDLERGIMDYGEGEAHIRQAMLSCSRLRAFVADNSKFGKTANVVTAPFSQIDQIITDKEPIEAFVQKCTESNTDLLHD